MDRWVMTRGVPAGEAGSHDTPTTPPLRVPQAGPQAAGGPGPAGGPEPAGGLEPAGGRPLAAGRHLPRWLRRALIVVLAIALAGALTFAGLMLATPSVSTAPLLAQIGRASCR